MSDSAFTRTNSAFAMTCRVRVSIRARAEVVWRLLTDAPGFPRWNSTVTAIEGQIREGERLKVHVPGTSRTFTPKVSDLVPARRMVWSDGVSLVFRGVRSFELTPLDDGSTDFVMEEHFSRLVFAMTKRMLPDFRPIFEAYANDLKHEAERVASAPASEIGTERRG